MQRVDDACMCDNKTKEQGRARTIQEGPTGLQPGIKGPVHVNLQLEGLARGVSSFAMTVDQGKSAELNQNDDNL